MAFNLKTFFFLQLTIMGQQASDITVNHEKIVLKKGDEITLKCTSDSEALGKVINTKYPNTEIKLVIATIRAKKGLFIKRPRRALETEINKLTNLTDFSELLESMELPDHGRFSAKRLNQLYFQPYFIHKNIPLIWSFRQNKFRLGLWLLHH